MEFELFLLLRIILFFLLFLQSFATEITADKNRIECKLQGNLECISLSFAPRPNTNIDREFAEMSRKAQNALYELNHPLDCTRSMLLLCSTRVNKFQGTGSRLFFLGRCLAEGLNTARAVVLTNDLPSTLDILQPFKEWGNCSLADSKINNYKRERVRVYFPMDSESLVKSPDMPAVGALFPKMFHEKGYWWWKSQEISYALRPTDKTLSTFKASLLYEAADSRPAVFQVRRTDKTNGCTAVYGKYSLSSKIKDFKFLWR